VTVNAYPGSQTASVSGTTFQYCLSQPETLGKAVVIGRKWVVRVSSAVFTTVFGEPISINEGKNVSKIIESMTSVLGGTEDEKRSRMYLSGEDNLGSYMGISHDCATTSTKREQTEN
jgi:hypothetical protein